MPRSSVVSAPAASPKVNVTVETPQPAVEHVEREEKSPTWFWDMLQNLPRDKWGNVYSVMAWREEPKVPGVPGAKGFLFEAFEPVTLSYFKEKYGGGKFKIVLQENSKFKTTHIFDIEGQPKYDLSREMPQGAHNGNGNMQDFQKEFISVLREELARSRDAQSSPSPGTDKVVEMLTNASEKAMEIVTKQTPGATNSTQQLSELVTIVKGLLPAQQNGLTLDSLLSFLGSPLMAKFFTPVDPLAQITTFLTIFEKLDALRGGSGESRAKDWRAMLAEGVVQKGPELLREMRETFQVNKDAAAERRRTAETIERVETIRRTPGSPPPGPALADKPTPVAPLHTVPIDRPASSNETGPPTAEGMSVSESDAVAVFLKRRIVEMIEDGRDAEDAVDFIEEVDPTLNDMLDKTSPDLITTFFSADPIMVKATQDPKWNKFLEQAKKYIAEIRAEDDAIDRASRHVPA